MINLGLHALWSLIIGMAWINEQVWQNFCYILHRWKTTNCSVFSSFATWKTASRGENCSNLNKRTYSFIRDLRCILNKLWAENGSTDFYIDISADVGTQRQTFFQFMKTRSFSWCYVGLAWKSLVKRTLFYKEKIVQTLF